MFLCHNEQACVLLQLCKIGGGTKSDHLAKGPLQNSSHYLLPTQSSPCSLCPGEECPWWLSLTLPQGLAGHLLPSQWSFHVITGCCGSIWEIIPTLSVDGLSAHTHGKFIPRIFSQSWRYLHHLLSLARSVCVEQLGKSTGMETYRWCRLMVTLGKAYLTIFGIQNS